MDSALTLRYTNILLVEALNQFARRRFLRPSTLILSLVFVGVLLLHGLLSAKSLRDWLGVAAIGAMCMAFWPVRILNYFSLKRNLQSLPRSETHVQISADGLTLEGANGVIQVKWHQVHEVWKVSEFWMLVFDKNWFLVVPLNCVEPGVLDFIRQKTPFAKVLVIPPQPVRTTRVE